MATSLSLYVDIYGRQLVTGPANNAPFNLPGWIQGGRPTLRIFLLARNVTYPTFSPFTIINNAPLALKVALGAKVGNAETLLTAQYTWSKDSANQYFTAEFPINTAEITTAIGTGSSATTWFEIEYIQDGKPFKALQVPTTIEAGVLKSGALVSIPGLNPLSREEADSVFAKQFGDVGQMQTYVSENGSWARIIGVNNNGERVDDVIAL
jgi:hypothetical protein